MKKPLLLYDGDCRFCRYWVLRWRRHTGERVEYATFQSEAPQHPKIPLERLQKSVHLVTPDGGVFNGAQAVFRALATEPHLAWPLWIYRHVPLMGRAVEFFYRLVADHRPLFSKLTRLLWGNELSPPDHRIARWIFLRALGAIYLIAFVSLWTQVHGLYGSAGIFPVAAYLQRIQEKFGAIFWQLPSIFWISASDRALGLVCGAGTICSLLIVTGVFPLIGLVGAWFLYLSFLTVGGPFLSFQWDILLLEVGFLAIFLAPLQWRSWSARGASPSKVAIFLCQLLLFKLMLSSGLVKLMSGDETWRNLTALTFHYETQPLPIWTSYFVHQLPAAAHKVCTVAMFAIELGFSFLIFAPRRLRYAACGALIALQCVILLTGNYTFFNYLAIALCVLLLDDSFWPRALRQRMLGTNEAPPLHSVRWPRLITLPLLGLILFLNLILWPARLGARPFIPEPLIKLALALNSFEFVNNYGLFAVMTTHRAEIIVEGSDDAQTWLPYEFKYKPGELSRRPVFVAPHQPRLDWQMWFAALGTVRDNPWFINFCGRLLQNSESVIGLLAKNPFPAHAPRYVRAVMYDYHFTTPSEKRTTQDWWQRSNERIYMEPISLR